MTRSVALAACAVLLAAAAVRAAPLDVAQCDALRTEQGQLEAKGARTDMNKGAQWAKSGLAQARVDQVGRLIAIDEQLLFRCANPKPIVQLKDEPQPEDTPADDVAPAVKKPAQKKQAAAKAPEKAAAAAPPAAQAPVQAAPQPAPQSAPKKARPKADDAYRPPAGTGSVLTAPPGVAPQ